MSDIFPIIIMIFSFIIPLLILGGIAYFIISLIKNKDKENKFQITSSLLLNIYLYTISFITLLLAVFGGALAIKSGLSSLVGIPFGYYVESLDQEDYNRKSFDDLPLCYFGVPTDIEGRMYCFDPEQREKDIVNGVTLFISMILIYALHQVGISKLKTKYFGIEKIYMFLSLAVYGIMGVIVIPMSIYQTMNYFLFKGNDFSSIEAPAMVIGLALLSVPLWVGFLLKNLKQSD
jgi:hypothetical protein